jgi:hypothetical protein
MKLRRFMEVDMASILADRGRGRREPTEKTVGNGWIGGVGVSVGFACHSYVQIARVFQIDIRGFWGWRPVFP